MEIITFGNGEILKGVFDAIVMCLNAETGTLYTPLIRIAMIFAVLWAALFAIWGDYLRAWGQAIIPFVFIPPILFVPTARVHIHDVVSNYHQDVDNVPYGLAYLGHVVSTVGYEVTKQVDQVFSQVDDLKYHKSGFLMASNLIQQARMFRITNEDIAENMRQFVCQCVAMDAMLGRKYTLEDLKHSADIWGLVSAQPSPIRSFIWRTPHNPGEGGNPPEIITCRDGVRRFNEIWGGELNRAKTLFGTKLFGFNDPIKAKQELMKYLPVSYEYLSGLAKGADQILKQQMMIHSVIDGIEQKSVALGNAPNFAARRAYLQQRSTYETLGAMASETLTTMKAVLEAIAYASFIFVIPLAILPFGVRIILSWAQILLWLQMWAPLYAVLNFIMTTTARYKSMGLVNISNPEGVTIASSVGLMNFNADMSAMAGYLAMSVPFLAIALVKGVGSFVHMASHLGNVSQGAASQAAGEAVTGNYSYGNISEGNMQIANTNMLTQSRAASYRAGSYQFVDGRTDMTTMGDGSQVVNVGTSNLPISPNVSESVSAQQSRMADKSFQRSMSQSEASSQNFASSYRGLVEFNKRLSEGQSLNDSMSQGVNAEHSKAIQHGAQLIKGFAKDNNISEEKAANLFAEASVGGGVFMKGAVGGKTSVNAADQVLLQKAEKYTQDHNFQAAMREASSASKNLSHSLNNDETKSLADSISGSYERGVQSRSEAHKSYQEGESHRAQAMYTMTNAASINANYNQPFMDWLANQPADHTTGRIGYQGAADMIANDPKVAMAYASKFVREEGLAPASSVSASPQTIKADYDKDTSHHVYKADQSAYNSVKEYGGSRVSARQVESGENLREEIYSDIGRTSQDIQKQSSDIQSQGQGITQTVKSQENRSVIKRAAQKVGKEIDKTVYEDIPSSVKGLFSGEAQQK